MTLHGDNARTGWNAHETVLNPSNVSPATFGLVAVAPDVQDEIAGQPLFASNLLVHDARTAGDTMEDVLFVATMENRVYALDAATLQTIWEFDFEGQRPPFASDLQPCQGMYALGATSTPVISADRSTMYVVGRVWSGTPTNSWFEGYAIRTHDGSIVSKFRVGETLAADGSRVPIVFNGTYNGTPVSVPYDATKYTQRSALLLVGSRLYISNGGICDTPGFRGWLFAYDTNSLSEQSLPVGTFVPSPGAGGGMWAAGGAASDGTSVFVAIGNGHAQMRAGTPDSMQSIADALVRLDGNLNVDTHACFNASTLGACGAGDTTNLSNVFMPRDAELLSQDDLPNTTGDIQGPDEDFGSSGPILIPPATLPENMVAGMDRNMAALGGKDGFFYLVDRDHMGGIGPSPLASASDIPNLVGAELDGQELYLHSTSGGIRATAAYFEGHSGRYLYVNGADAIATRSDAPTGLAALRLVPTSDATPTACANEFRTIAYQQSNLPCATIWGSTMRPGMQLAWSGDGPTLGASPFVSSNGSDNGIVWQTVESISGGPGLLEAYVAENGSGTGVVATSLYRSDRVVGDALPGTATTFAGPIVANGHVYVTGATFVAAYGNVPARAVPPLPEPPTPPDCAPGVSWESFGQPFMNHYCTSCHAEYQSLNFIQGRLSRIADQVDPTSGTPGMPLIRDASNPPPLPTDAERTELGAWLRCGAPATHTRLHAGYALIGTGNDAFVGDVPTLDPNQTGTLTTDQLGTTPLTNPFAPAVSNDVFRLARLGPAEWRVPIPGTGHYAVTLYFAQDACAAAGTACDAPFNVTLNGTLWMSGFDILAHVPQYTAVAQSTAIDVASGSQLRIDLSGGGQVQGIDVVRTDACTTDADCPLGFACMAGACVVNAARADGGVGGDAGTIVATDDGGTGDADPTSAGDGGVRDDGGRPIVGIDGAVSASDGGSIGALDAATADGAAQIDGASAVDGSTTSGTSGCHCSTTGGGRSSKFMTVMFGVLAYAVLGRRSRGMKWGERH